MPAPPSGDVEMTWISGRTCGPCACASTGQNNTTTAAALRPAPHMATPPTPVSNDPGGIVSVPFANSDREHLAMRLSGHRGELHGDPDQLGQVPRIELLLELRAGVDDGLVAHAQRRGDAAVGFAFGEQPEH